MIYMHHVIEHVPNPLETFRTLKGLLAPGGLIFGQTPDLALLGAPDFGDDWAQWHQPHHLTFFDKQTMAAHARRLAWRWCRSRLPFGRHAMEQFVPQTPGGQSAVRCIAGRASRCIRS